MNKPYMSGAELEVAETVSPADVISSLHDYVITGGDIDPTVYDEAIGRCEPPMNQDNLEEVIEICVEGIRSRHMPKTPIDHDRSGRQSVEINTTQSHFAGLLGAASVRIAKLESSSPQP
ncbi:MAG: hypothetical protein ACHQT9_00165 [Candidatus Saccharimonadales bacterium]